MPNTKVLLPSLSGWYGVTEPGSKVAVMDGSRPRTMEKKPVIFAEELKAEQGPHGDLSGKISRSLAGTMGVTYETFLCLFDRVNLLRHWEENRPPELSSLKVMAESCGRTGNYWSRGEPLLLMGGRVIEAFGFGISEWYEWSFLGEIPCVAIPHLTHLNPTMRQMAQAVLERALLYHGKIFRVGQWPNGDGSMVMISGEVWGDAERRLRHRAKAELRSV